METNNMRLTAGCSAQLRVLGEAEGGTGRTISGYAIVFGQESRPLWTERGKPCVEVISASAVTKELLDRSNIKMTMYHDMGKLLARSKNGAGSLSYTVDDHGVAFRFEAPETQYGDEALALVARGDIDGCSFMFVTDYGSEDCVSRDKLPDKVVYTVKDIRGIYDFTLTPDPAYPQTECALRSKASEERVMSDERRVTSDELRVTSDELRVTSDEAENRRKAEAENRRKAEADALRRLINKKIYNN